MTVKRRIAIVNRWIALTVTLMVSASALSRAVGAQSGSDFPVAPPVLAHPRAVTTPTPVEATLVSGLVLWAVHRPGPALAEVALVVRHRMARSDAYQSVALLTAELMVESRAGFGSTHSASDRAEQLGGSLDATIRPNATIIRLRAPVERLNEGVAILSDLARAPHFRASSLLQVRKRLANETESLWSDPWYVANKTMESLLESRGTTPMQDGVEAARRLRRVSLADVNEWHANAFLPESATVIVVGSLPTERAQALSGGLFGTWPRRSVARPSLAPKRLHAPAWDSARRGQVVNVAASAQVSVRLAAKVTGANDAEATVLAAMLGGAQTSRLNLALRERHGFAYHVGGSIQRAPGGVRVQLSAELDPARLDSALHLIDAELSIVRDSSLEASYVAAQRYVLLGVPTSVETPRAIADWLVDLSVAGAGSRDFSLFPSRLAQVTPARLRTLAQGVLSEGLQVAITGDSALVLQALRADSVRTPFSVVARP